MNAAVSPGYLDGLDLSLMGDALQGARVSRLAGDAVPVYEFGDPAADKLVLLPPYGVTFLLVARLAHELARRFHVLTWESAGCPDTEPAFAPEQLELATQADQMRAALLRRGIQRYHFVGWCQAAQLSVKLLETGGPAPRSLSWIAPAGLGQALLQSEFDRCALPIYEEIAGRGLAHAAMLSGILDKYRNEPLSAGIAGEKLSMLHLAAPATTLRFAHYMRRYASNAGEVRGLLPAVLGDCPLLLVHCKDDSFSHYSESVQLSRMVPAATLRLLDHGGHLQVFNAAGVVAPLIVSFIDGLDGQPGAAEPAPTQLAEAYADSQ